MENCVIRSIDVLEHRRALRTRHAFLNALAASAAFFLFTIAYAYTWSGYYIQTERSYDLCWRFSHRPAAECHI